MIAGAALALLLAPAAAAPDSFEIHLAAGRYAAADRAARGALESALRAPGPDSLAVAEALERQVRVGVRLSRSGPEEVARARHALALRERARGAQDPGTVGALNLLASALWSAGRAEEARETARRALARLDAAGPGNDAERARGLAVLANLDLDAGESDRAIEGWTEVHALRVRSGGAESPDAAQALHALGVAYRNAGRLTDALRAYRGALAIRERALGAEHPDVAWTLNNLANATYDLGDYAEAARLHRRALAIRERVFGPDHAQVALSLMNLGNALERAGDPGGAVPLHERALAIWERANGAWHRSVAQCLNNLALARASLGDLAGARPLYERSIAIRDSLLGPGSEEAARSRLRLGVLLLRAGDATGAERVLRDAVEANRRTLGASHPFAQDATLALAEACLRLGRDAEALELALGAEEVTARHLRTTARGLDEAQALVYAAHRSSGLQVALTVAAAAPRDTAIAARAWDALVRSRSVVLDEMASRRRWAAAAHDSATRGLVAAVAGARDRLARLAVRGAASDSASRAALAAAVAAKNEAERALAERSLPFRRELRGADAGLADVAAALPPRGALVSYVWYAQMPRGGVADTTERVAALVLAQGGGGPRLVPLADAREVDGATSAWLAAIGRRPDPLRRGRDEAACESRGRALRRLVWDPLLPFLAGAERVFVVPDGALRIAPLAALPDGRGGALVESGPLLHLLGAERDLAAGAAPPGEGHGLLAIGGPSFDLPSGARRAPARAGGDPCAALAGGRFDPLPGAAAEAMDVARAWDAAAGANAGREDRARALTADLATERALREGAPGRRALHLAVHGFFLPERCPIAGGGLEAVDRRHPLLRAGLALAGANHHAAAADAADDGILTAEEVAGLDLGSLEWAVLSACETGLGRLDVNEGVLGLRRAFRLAGAQTLVMSLWRVDDAATAEWMRALYRARFALRLDPARAARAATLSVLRARRSEGRTTHPYGWAAFVAECGALPPPAGPGGGPASR